MKKIMDKSFIFLNSIIMIVICIFLYVLSLNIYKRIDLTENKIYTISDSTKKILKNLKDIVNIDLYFSENLPPYLIPKVEQIKDIIDEYKSYGGNKLIITYHNPDNDKKLQQKLMFMGIPKVQVNVIEKEQAAIKNIYLGIAVSYQDKVEVIPFVENISNLEYDLTSAIVKVTMPKKKVVGILTKEDNLDFDKKYSNLKKVLKKEYEVKWIDFSKEDTKIPKNIDTLIVISPDSLSDYQKYQIDQFVMKSKNVIFLLNPVKLYENTLTAVSSHYGLEEILSMWGVKTPKRLLMDKYMERAPFSSGYVTYVIPYPYWVKAINDNFNKNNPIVGKLNSIVFPWCGYIEKNEKVKNVKFIELVKSSKYAKSISAPFDLMPDKVASVYENAGKQSQYIIAAEIRGKFKSFFINKKIPEPMSKKDSKKKDENKDKTEKFIKESTKNTRIIIVANSYFVENNFTQQFPQNLVFLQNIVDSMTLGNDLISIRSRKVVDRPLKIDTESKSVKIIKFINIFGGTIILWIFGLILFLIKKQIRNLKVKKYIGG